MTDPKAPAVTYPKPSDDAKQVDPKVEDDTQTWISSTDKDGKTHRVKSEDYKDGA